jgi:glycosyltransferase involved in cell wall biosynthesis
LAARDVQGDGDGPLVSVVMPVHNAERFLREAIESALGQTHRALELVLVDDGSTDGSWAIAQELAAGDARVKAFRNPHNLGIVKTRNRAFAEADPRSEYFAVLDSDDVCMPDRLERQVGFLRAHPDHGLVGGNTLIIDEHGAEVGERRYPSTHEQIIKVITRYNPIAQPSVMIRRSALREVGQYDERYPRCQDYDLWLRMAARWKLANLDSFTLKYRISATQGKRVKLRDSLRFTIDIQRQWLFHPAFFRPFNVLYWVAEHGLLLLPEPLVLGLFKFATYRGSSASR